MNRPSLEYTIKLVKMFHASTLYFSFNNGTFSVTDKYSSGAVKVLIGGDVRKSIRKGLDSLEKSLVEARRKLNKKNDYDES